MNRILSGWFLGACVLVSTALAATESAKPADTNPGIDKGWHELGRVHVRDSAEKDLAVLHDGEEVVEVRLCAERNAIRLRNAELWMTGDKRQKLWLPLVLDAGKCSDASDVQGGPIRVTHVALEYEAMSLGAEGAHLAIYGRAKSKR